MDVLVKICFLLYQRLYQMVVKVNKLQCYTSLTWKTDPGTEQS